MSGQIFTTWNEENPLKWTSPRGPSGASNEHRSVVPGYARQNSCMVPGFIHPSFRYRTRSGDQASAASAQSGSAPTGAACPANPAASGKCTTQPESGCSAEPASARSGEQQCSCPAASAWESTGQRLRPWQSAGSHTLSEEHKPDHSRRSEDHDGFHGTRADHSGQRARDEC
jgi:hypothetical protein